MLPKLFNRREIEALIAAGQTIIIFEKDVLRVNNGWQERHPGGKLVFDHMIGRDATDEISACVFTEARGLEKRHSQRVPN